jgi:hypothetical protein
MKKLALGIIMATALFAAAPAMAFDVHVGAGGLGVGIGVPGPYYHDGCGYNYPCRGYYDYYSGPDIAVGDGWHGRGHGHGHEHSDGHHR